jgi:hypothetical protein
LTPSSEQRRTTVLIVDDEDDMRVLVKVKLELAGDGSSDHRPCWISRQEAPGPA